MVHDLREIRYDIPARWKGRRVVHFSRGQALDQVGRLIVPRGTRDLGAVITVVGHLVTNRYRDDLCRNRLVARPVGDVEAVGDVADDPVGVIRVLPAEATLQLELTWRIFQDASKV